VGVPPPNIPQRCSAPLRLPYYTAEHLAAGPIDELLQRIELLRDRGLMGGRPTVAAVLGGVALPAIRLSNLLEHYEDNAGDVLRGKSADQLRKWRNVRKRAIANLAALIGDLPIAKISRTHALEFRRWWLARIEDESLDIGTANKDIGTLNALINGVDEKHQLGLTRSFGALRLRGEKHNPRVPYAPEFVEHRILAPGALDALNPEARAITYLVAVLGMRPSEACGLVAGTIVLSHDVPHIIIAPTARQIKNRAAARSLPLIGLALRIMSKFPGGFERYRDGPDALSATVNEALGAANLRPTPEHTLYSLRHTFQDLLTAAEVPPRIDHDLWAMRSGALSMAKGHRCNRNGNSSSASPIRCVARFLCDPVARRGAGHARALL